MAREIIFLQTTPLSLSILEHGVHRSDWAGSFKEKSKTLFI